MKLALIPPIQFLQDTFQSDYQLALAHLFKNPDYAKTYETHAGNADGFLILDNGAFEGSLVDSRDLISLANRIQPNELVIPDAMKQAEVSIEMAKQFLEMVEGMLTPHVGLMFVAQGSSGFEMVQSIEWALEQERISTIGIPRHTAETTGMATARINFAREIAMSSRGDKAVHLLGASPLWTDEFRHASSIGSIRGMDTSMPYVYGSYLQRLPSDAVLNRKPGYFEEQYDEAERAAMTHNVDYMLGEVDYYDAHR